MNRFILLFTLLFFTLSVEAQDILSAELFMRQVALHHPLAKQADLQINRGDALVLKARGGFDPKVGGDLRQKYFDGDSYYSMLNAGLKVPTWFGIQLEGGYDQTGGQNLNPEFKTPEDGLIYAGLSMALGKGLFMDERRAALRQAQIHLESSKVKRQLLLNQLVLEAAEAYWKWFKAYNSMLVYEEGFALADQRFNAVRGGAELGDRPYIDTLEAGIQLQNRNLMLQESRMNFKNASAYLEVFLWEDGIIPLELAATTIPPTMDNTESSDVEFRLLNALDTIGTNHLKLLEYRFMVEGLEVEQRWKNEQLKPTVNLKYNALSTPVNGDVFSTYSPSNYNWGLEVSMPLLLRKERGNFRLNNLKIQEANYEIASMEQAIRSKAEMAINEWSTSFSQVNLYRRTVLDYGKLLDGERQLFNGGESSLFMVNSREMNYMKAKLKLVDLLVTNHMAAVQADFSFGSMGTIVQ